MADVEPERSQRARAAAELALVRVVHHYGGKPGFVLLGGLVPQLLCSGAPIRHAGTTDIDVQVDLEIARGATNTARLEQALGNAEFRADSERVWRWRTETGAGAAEIKFELLADLDTQPQGVTVKFDDCNELGAINLRGTGYAARDTVERELSANDGGVWRAVRLDVTGLGGFLLAKAAAANGRHKPKDWYDIAYVLLHNDHGGPAEAAGAVAAAFGSDVTRGEARTWMVELAENFHNDHSQGTLAYLDQVLVDHPELDAAELVTDAQLAVAAFCGHLLG